MKNFSMTLYKPLFASFMLHRCNRSPFLDTLRGFEYTSLFHSSQLIDSEQDTTDKTSCHLEKTRPGAWQPDRQHDYGAGYGQLMFAL
jgi:hypothetical protein